MRGRMRGFQALQQIYMPGLLQYQTDIARLATLPPATSNHAEDLELYLPSGVATNRRRAVCMENLPAMEERHRTAQCHDTLNTIRNTLRLKTHMVYFKNINSRGQKDGLRSRSMIDRVQGKVGTAARKYREG